MNHQMKLGALLSYISIAFNILSVLLYTPLLIKGLGSSDYAIYTLVYSFLNYFVIDFGIGSSVARFITEFRYDSKEKYKERELLAVVFKCFFVLAAMMAVVLFLMYPFLGDVFSGLTGVELDKMRYSYKIAAVYSVVAFLSTPLESIFTANEFFAQLKTCKLIQKAGTIILTILSLALSKGLLFVMLAGTISGITAILVEIFYLTYKKAIDIEWRFWDYQLLKMVLNFSIWMAIVTFAQRFIIPITPTILGMVSNSSEIAMFSISSNLEGYVFTFAAALNGLFLPQVSRLINSGNIKELNDLQTRIGRIQLFIVSLILTGATVFGKEFISLWAGYTYEKAYYIFLLISWSDIFYLTQEIACTTLTVIGEVKYRAVVYTCGAAISTTLSFVLGKRLGALGSAIAIAICLWFFNVFLMSVVYQKKTEIDMLNFYKRCHLKVLPIQLLYAAAWGAFDYLLPKGRWLTLILKIVIYSAGLLMVDYTFLFNKAEKNLLNKMRKRMIFR